jgi:hypothetical protein
MWISHVELLRVSQQILEQALQVPGLLQVLESKLGA